MYAEKERGGRRESTSVENPNEGRRGKGALVVQEGCESRRYLVTEEGSGDGRRKHRLPVLVLVMRKNLKHECYGGVEFFVVFEG